VPSSFTWKQRITLAFAPPLAALLIRLLGVTLRYQDIAEPGITPGYAIPGPTVYAFWHRSLLACAHRFRGLDIAILISPSFDGELIARTVELLGFRAIRGSSSRGGAAGLRGMQQAYAEGHRCAFTSDGPRGPVFRAKPGAAQLALSVTPPPTAHPCEPAQPHGQQPSTTTQPAITAQPGTWVGCFYALPTRAWQLRSWDRFLIPKPFARVLLTWPAHIPAAAVTPEAVQAALDRAVALADRDPRVDPALRITR
jgi:lysophospholipid acyltransferase (LPLAT)-like uncharacterized protein